MSTPTTNLFALMKQKNVLDKEKSFRTRITEIQEEIQIQDRMIAKIDGELKTLMGWPELKPVRDMVRGEIRRVPSLSKEREWRYQQRLLWLRSGEEKMDEILQNGGELPFPITQDDPLLDAIQFITQRIEPTIKDKQAKVREQMNRMCVDCRDLMFNGNITDMPATRKEYRAIRAAEQRKQRKEREIQEQKEREIQEQKEKVIHHAKQEEARLRSAPRIASGEFRIWRRKETPTSEEEILYTRSRWPYGHPKWSQKDCGNHVWGADYTPQMVDGVMCHGPRLGSYRGVTGPDCNGRYSRSCYTDHYGNRWDGTTEPTLYE